DLAVEHVDERMGGVPMDHVSCARRIRHLKHATLLARVVREIDREQFLHVCGCGWDGCEHQECRQVSAEVQVGLLHLVPFRIVVGTRYLRIDALDSQSECLREVPRTCQPARACG